MSEIRRDFVHPTQISPHLKCSICSEVFSDPVRAKCGHTFCRNCIESWIKNRNKAAPCPFCRQSMTLKNLKKDLLATQIINDFEIFCPNRSCPWQGPLGNVSFHINFKCGFKGEKLPAWYQTYLKSQEEEMEKKDLEAEAYSPSLREKINQNKEIPLAMRLYKPGDEGLRFLLENPVQEQKQDFGEFGLIMGELKISPIEEKSEMPLQKMTTQDLFDDESESEIRQFKKIKRQLEVKPTVHKIVEINEENAPSTAKSTKKRKFN